MTTAISKDMINRLHVNPASGAFSSTTTPSPPSYLQPSTYLTSSTSKMSSKQIIRNPSHAGSWYTSSKSQLNSQLDGWLDDVKTPVTCIGPRTEGQQVDQLPVPGARIIIGP
jgi:hypothetical protein